jgi:septal ring factor EnvC (AmiA/AmiB activator)
MANISEMQIGLDVLIGLSSGVVGTIGAYIRLKSRIDMVEAKNKEQSKEIDDLRDRKKEMNIALNKRIDDQKETISKLQTTMSTGHAKLETLIAKMELRIVEKITNAINKTMK